jgi:hypothetical protein
MEKIVYRSKGRQVRHVYETMTRAKRPQDVGRNGSKLRFEALEHHGFDCCPEAVAVTDAKGRRAVYTVEIDYGPRARRPQDSDLRGGDLRFETLEHGGEYPDSMPQRLRVTDEVGRSALYRPIAVDGKVVDSKGFWLEADPAWKGKPYEPPHVRLVIGKRFAFEQETIAALGLLARRRKRSLQQLADEAFRDLLLKHRAAEPKTRRRGSAAKTRPRRELRRA